MSYACLESHLSKSRTNGPNPRAKRMDQILCIRSLPQAGQITFVDDGHVYECIVSKLGQRDLSGGHDREMASAGSPPHYLQAAPGALQRPDGV